MFYGKLENPADKTFLRDTMQRFGRMFGRVHAADNLITFGRVFSIFEEKQFREVLGRQATTAQERTLGFRLNTLIWAAYQALRVPGDFVELGVWRGFCSGVLTDYLEFQKIQRTFWLYDTFEGIPHEYDTENHDSPALREPGLYEGVMKRFENFPNVRVIRGVIPHSLEEAAPSAVSFLHIDLNSSKSEIEALNYLWDRIVPGGVVVFDDYGWWNYRAQHFAERDWMAERGERILELPSGQGLVIKR